jgi:TP901 family phage tail tape measure protein
LPDEIVSSLGIDVSDFIKPMEDVSQVLASVSQSMIAFGGKTVNFDNNLNKISGSITRLIGTTKKLTETFATKYITDPSDPTKKIAAGLEQVSSRLTSTIKQFQDVNKEVKLMANNLIGLGKTPITSKYKEDIISQFVSKPKIKTGTPQEIETAQRAVGNLQKTLESLINTQQLTEEEAYKVGRAFKSGDFSEVLSERYQKLIRVINDTREALVGVGKEAASGKVKKGPIPTQVQLDQARHALTVGLTGGLTKGMVLSDAEQSKLTGSVDKVIDKYGSLNNIDLKRFSQIFSLAYNSAHSNLEGMEADLFKFMRASVETVQKIDNAWQQHQRRMNELTVIEQKIAGMVTMPSAIPSVDPKKAQQLEIQWKKTIEKISDMVIEGKFDDTEIQEAIAASKKSFDDLVKTTSRRIQDLALEFKKLTVDTYAFANAEKEASDQAAKLAAKTASGGPGPASPLPSFVNKTFQEMKDTLAGGAGKDLLAGIPTKSLKYADIQRISKELVEMARNIALGKITMADFNRELENIQGKKILPSAGADIDNLRRGLTSALSSIDNMKTGITGLASAFQFLKSITRLFIVAELYQLRAAFEQALQQAIQDADKLYEQIGLIRAITQDANKTEQDWINTLRAVSDETGRSIGDVAVGAYDALSNQITRTTEDTSKFVIAANNLARATGATLPIAVDVLSVAINSFGKSTEDAGELSSQLFAAVDIGRLKLADIHNILGRVGNTAHALGVSFGEMMASLATLTRVGLSSEDAITRLNNLLIKLFNPTQEMKDLFRELGVTSGEQLIKMKGLAGALQVIDQAIRRGSASAQKLFPEIRTLGGYFGLTGDNADKLTEAMQVTNNNLENYKGAIETTLSPSQKFHKSLEQIKNLFTVGFGTEFIKAFNWLNDLFGSGGLSTAIGYTTEALITLIKVGMTVAAMKVAWMAYEAFMSGAMVAAIWKVTRAMLTLGATSLLVNPFTWPIVAAVGAFWGTTKALEVMDRMLKQAAEDRRKLGEEMSKKLPQNIQAEGRVSSLSSLGADYRSALSEAIRSMTARANQAWDVMIDHQKKKVDELKDHAKSAFKEMLSFLDKLKSQIESTIQDAREAGQNIDTRAFDRHLKNVETSYNSQMQIEKSLQQERMGGGQNYARQLDLLNAKFKAQGPYIDELNRKIEKLYSQGKVQEAQAAEQKLQGILEQRRDAINSLNDEMAQAFNRQKQPGEYNVFVSQDQLRRAMQLVDEYNDYVDKRGKDRAAKAGETAKAELEIVLDTMAKARAAEDAAFVDINKLFEEAKPKGTETKIDAFNRVAKPYTDALNKGIDSIHKIKSLADKKGLSQELDAILSNLEKKLGDFKHAQAGQIALQIDQERIQKGANAAITEIEKLGKSAEETKIKLAELATEIHKTAGEMAAMGGRPTGWDWSNFGMGTQKFDEEFNKLKPSMEHIEESQKNAPQNVQQETESLLKKLEELKQKFPEVYNTSNLESFIDYYKKLNEAAQKYNDLRKEQTQKTDQLQTEVEEQKSILENFQSMMPGFAKLSDTEWEQFKDKVKSYEVSVVQSFGRISASIAEVNKQLGLIGSQGPQLPPETRAILQGRNAIKAPEPINETSQKITDIWTQVIKGQLTATQAEQQAATELKQAGITQENTAQRISDIWSQAIRGEITAAQAQQQAAEVLSQAAAASIAPPVPAQAKALGGRVADYFATGGPKGTDTVPTWLTPGEFVMPQNITEKYLPILELMRSGKYMQGGGMSLPSVQSIGESDISDLLAKFIGIDAIGDWLNFNESGGGGGNSTADINKAHGLVPWMSEGGFVPQVQSFSQAKGFAKGGGIGGSTTNNSNSNTINVSLKSGTPENIARQLGREINREIRRGNIKFSN